MRNCHVSKDEGELGVNRVDLRKSIPEEGADEQKPWGQWVLDAYKAQHRDPHVPA